MLNAFKNQGVNCAYSKITTMMYSTILSKGSRYMYNHREAKKCFKYMTFKIRPNCSQRTLLLPRAQN